MAAPDRIRLTGRLRREPRQGALSTFGVRRAAIPRSRRPSAPAPAMRLELRRLLPDDDQTAARLRTARRRAPRRAVVDPRGAAARLGHRRVRPPDDHDTPPQPRSARTVAGYNALAAARADDRGRGRARRASLRRRRPGRLAGSGRRRLTTRRVSAWSGRGARLRVPRAARRPSPLCAAGRRFVVGPARRSRGASGLRRLRVGCTCPVRASLGDRVGQDRAERGSHEESRPECEQGRGARQARPRGHDAAPAGRRAQPQRSRGEPRARPRPHCRPPAAPSPPGSAVRCVRLKGLERRVLRGRHPRAFAPEGRRRPVQPGVDLALYVMARRHAPAPVSV